MGYKYGESPSCNPETGHMTQVVWKDSTEVGCAVAETKWNPGSCIWACNYSNPGNVQGNTDAATIASYAANV